MPPATRKQAELQAETNYTEPWVLKEFADLITETHYYLLRRHAEEEKFQEVEVDRVWREKKMTLILESRVTDRWKSQQNS